MEKVFMNPNKVNFLGHVGEIEGRDAYFNTKKLSFNDEENIDEGQDFTYKDAWSLVVEQNQKVYLQTLVQSLEENEKDFLIWKVAKRNYDENGTLIGITGATAIEGIGRCQIIKNDGIEVLKSNIFYFVISEALDEDAEVSSPSIDSWVAELTTAGKLLASALGENAELDEKIAKINDAQVGAETINNTIENINDLYDAEKRAIEASEYASAAAIAANESAATASTAASTAVENVNNSATIKKEVEQLKTDTIAIKNEANSAKSSAITAQSAAETAQKEAKTAQAAAEAARKAAEEAAKEAQDAVTGETNIADTIKVSTSETTIATEEPIFFYMNVWKGTKSEYQDLIDKDEIKATTLYIVLP